VTLVNIEALRRRLLLSIAGTLATGCGTTAPDGGDGSDSGGQVESSDGTTGTTSSDSLSASSAPPTGTSSTDGDGSDDDTMRFDAGMTYDVPPDLPPGCPPQPEPPAETCEAELPSTEAYFLFYCVDLSSGLSCEKWSSNASDPDATWPITECNNHDCTGPYVIDIGCGPLPDLGDQCCFWFVVEDTQTCPGRPFVVAGRERLAALTERDDWMADTTLAVEAGCSHRAAIAAAWAEQAAFEHASIASFSRFILQLLACGAPAHLVAAAQVALGEEIEHARLFFAFASRYAGRPVGPTALATHDALAAGDGFDEIVLATVREGCIAETISAWHVTLAAKSARDPAMAHALARVAEQELEHAALAWSFLAWALPRASDSLRRRIDATLHTPARHAPRGPALATTLSAADWLAHGILPTHEHTAATQHALHELVVPLARSLPNRISSATIEAGIGTVEITGDCSSFSVR
jgi:hypothetical protein